MSFLQTSSRARARQLVAALAATALFVFGLASAGGGASPAQAADVGGAFPICDPGAYPDAPSWYRTSAEIKPFYAGQTQFVSTYQVGSGLTHGCASQQWASLKQECTTVSNGTSCKYVHNDWETMPLSSVPQQVDAAGGDEQAVTVTLPSATSVNWGECLPRSGLGTVQCPSSVSDSTANPGYSGTVLFRFRQPNGEFTGPWQVSQRDSYSGFASPGFMLQAEHGACSKTATSCRWLVRFTRDTLNQPAILRDVQLLLTFSVTFKNNIGETGFADVAVPLLVLQRGGPAGTPTPAPVTPAPTAAPQVPTSGTTGAPGSPATGGATGGGSSAASATDLLTVKTTSIKVKRNAAKLSLACAAGSACDGKVTLRRSARSTKSLGTTSFKLSAGKKRGVTVKLNSRGRKLLKGKKKTRLEAVVTFRDGSVQVIALTLRR